MFIENVLLFFTGVLCGLFCIYFSLQWIMTGLFMYALKGIVLFILAVINIAESLDE